MAVTRLAARAYARCSNKRRSTHRPVAMRDPCAAALLAASHGPRGRPPEPVAGRTRGSRRTPDPCL